MAKKPITVVKKNRLRALALPLANASGLRPALASSDYILFPIHDGSASAIKVSRDSYFGAAEVRSKHPQWWSIDIALNYPETDPDAPRGSMIHYMFKAITPFQVSYVEMKRYVNQVLSELYPILGRGTGSVYASIMPNDIVQKYIDSGKLEVSPRDLETSLRFDDWTVGFDGELHDVDPSTIEQWEKPTQD